MLTQLIVLVVLVGLLVLLSLRLGHRVPSGHVGVVFDGDTYVRMVTPGVLWLRPGAVLRTVAIHEQQVRTSGTVLQAEDGATSGADLRVAYRVDDPVRSLSAVHDAAYAVERDAVAALRAFALSVTAADLLASNVRAADQVRADLTPRLHGWGLEVLRVEVVVHPGDPDPSR